MNKDKILEKIKEESNRLDTLRAIRNYYKKQNDDSYRIERCENALQVSVDKLFELSQKLKEVK
tara:strand:- start:480 stop:668 length:189 start_codon:yes stop_codon:yes gene_type:complete